MRQEKEPNKEQDWIVKQEPTDYSWEAFEEEGVTAWTGMRNYQARNYLLQMGGISL